MSSLLKIITFLTRTHINPTQSYGPQNTYFSEIIQQLLQLIIRLTARYSAVLFKFFLNKGTVNSFVFILFKGADQGVWEKEKNREGATDME